MTPSLDSDEYESLHVEEVPPHELLEVAGGRLWCSACLREADGDCVDKATRVITIWEEIEKWPR